MWLGKRLFDFILSLIGLVVLSPLFFLIACWIKTDSPGPVFFRQERMGRQLVPFRIHKFRTMGVEAEQRGMQITVGADSRITRSGQFLRKYKLDELPQLIDVLIGSMSLVGPRPEVPKYVRHYSESDREIVFRVRPGITDWASIKFRDESRILGEASDPEQAYINDVLPIKLEYAKSYATSSSLREDVVIILQTILVIIRG